MNKLKKNIRGLFIYLFARKTFQPAFKALHWLSLRGMNYGGGYSPYDSGELHVLKILKEFFEGKIILFDVGANVGQYALLANRTLQQKCRIYSFEPTVAAYKLLQKNSAKINNISIFNYGLGNTRKKVFIYSDDPGSVQSSIVEKSNNSSTEVVELTTINEFCKENKITKIDFLKIDVEGYEYEVLLGASDFMDEISFIQFEFGNKQVASRNFLRDFIFLLRNFKIYRILQDGLVRIDENPINEIFQTSNYLAINKNIPLSKQNSKSIL